MISTDFNTSVKRFTCSTVIFLPTSPIVARYWKPSFILYNKDNHESNFFELPLWNLMQCRKSKFFTVIQFNIEENCVSPTLWEILVHTCGNVSQFYGKCNIRNKLFPTEKNSILHMNVNSIVRMILNNATFIYIDFNKGFFISVIEGLNNLLKLYCDERFSYLNEKFKIIYYTFFLQRYLITV